MKKAPLAAAFVLTLLPGIAAAMCSGEKYDTTTASACGEGQVYDATTRACVSKPSS
jgi:hypothetical protein